MAEQPPTVPSVGHFRSIARICEAVDETLEFQAAIDQMLSAMLDVFQCDTALLIEPSDSSKREFKTRGHVGGEATQPAHWGVELLRKLDTGSCVRFDANSSLAVAVPHAADKAWILSLSRTDSSQPWSNGDCELAQIAAQRVSGVLNNLEMHRRLQQREERLQLAIESAGDGIWDWQIDSGEIVFSDSWAEILGYSPEEMPCTLAGLESLVHPDDLDRVRKELQAHLRGETVRYDCEHRLRTKQGRWKWVLDRGKVAARDADGNPLRFLGTRRDISTTKHAEAMLLRERRLFTGGPCIVFRWVATEGWPVEYVSPNVKEFFGYSAQDFMTGRIPYSDVVYPEDLARVADEVSSHTADGRADFEQEYRIVRPCGEVRWLYDFTVIHRNEEGEVTHYEGYVLDATERKQAEQERLDLVEQMQHAQKLESLGVLAGGIAHDFNNLLMGVLGHADLALEQLDAESPAVSSVIGIHAAARQAADLTQQMLAYAGKGKYLTEAMRVNTVIREMTRLLEVTLSKTARIEYKLADNLPAVEADGSQLGQVIMNLITNAAEAIGNRDGTISIRTAVEEVNDEYCANHQLTHELAAGSYVLIEVHDTGVGMSEQTQRKIFEPFFSTKFTGRGLGLAAVLGIVKGHGGSLSVNSEVDRGTSVRVLIPTSEQKPRAAQSDSNIHQWSGAGTILLVDDEETIRDVGSLMLASLGFDVITAADGFAAIEIFKQRHDEFICVLLDLTMPGLGGEEVFYEMCQIKPDVAVVLSSGYNQTDVVQKFAGKDLAGFVQKPYGRKNLAKVLRSVLGGSSH